MANSLLGEPRINLLVSNASFSANNLIIHLRLCPWSYTIYIGIYIYQYTIYIGKAPSETSKTEGLSHCETSWFFPVHTWLCLCDAALHNCVLLRINVGRQISYFWYDQSICDSVFMVPRQGNPPTLYWLLYFCLTRKIAWSLARAEASVELLMRSGQNLDWTAIHFCIASLPKCHTQQGGELNL